MNTKQLMRCLARETRPSMKKALTARLVRKLKRRAPHEVIEMVSTTGPIIDRLLPATEDERLCYTSFASAGERKTFDVQAWLTESELQS